MRYRLFAVVLCLFILWSTLLDGAESYTIRFGRSLSKKKLKARFRAREPLGAQLLPSNREGTGHIYQDIPGKKFNLLERTGD